MRRLCSILAIAAIAVSLGGCESQRGRNPYETSLPSSKFGFRVTNGQLRIWTGSPCEGTTEIVVKVRGPGSDEATLQIYTPTYEPGLTPGIEFEHLTLGGPYPGFNVMTPLPPGFDWRKAEYFQIDVGGPPVSRGLGRNFAPIATEIIVHSAEHPENTYYFPDVGWLDPAEVAAKNGNEFLTVCTPDPAKEESNQSVVGVRVTDGTLRFWTGTPCPYDAGVIISFQPGQAETILQKKDHPREDVEYLTLDQPNPEFTVTHPLPRDFDWRTAKTVLFRLIDTNGLVWSKTTELATPIAESAQHPPDTYYFEGIGWLNPAEVAARDGTSMDTICGK